VAQRGELRSLKRGLRTGTSSGSGGRAAGDALRELAAGVDAGKYSRRRALQVVAGARVSPDVEQFKRLTAVEAEEVFKLASPAERHRWGPYLGKKLENAVKSGRPLPRSR